MPLSRLPGPWSWERRNGMWWRVHKTQGIEDGPHTWRELNAGMGSFGDMHSHWYDRDGEPIPMMVWSDLKEDTEYSVIAKTYYSDGPDKLIEVSTVWLGLDHNWWPEPHVPIIYETMVFGNEGMLGDYQERYATAEAALEGHQTACAWVLETYPGVLEQNEHVEHEED